MAQATLASYRLQVRRLLHDANGQFYSDSDVNEYCNTARLAVCRDSGCNRSFPPISTALVQGVESYPFTYLAPAVIGIWGIKVIFGNTRYDMIRKSYSELTNLARPYVGWTAMPVYYAEMDQGFFMAPMPDQAYPIEVDAIVYPGDLTSDGQAEQIPLMWQAPVKFWGAREAKMASQDWAEAELMEKHYLGELFRVRRGRGLRIISNPNAIGMSGAFTN